jgi:hypothetical protein
MKMQKWTPRAVRTTQQFGWSMEVEVARPIGSVSVSLWVWLDYVVRSQLKERR